MVCIARDVVCFCSLHHLDTCTDEEEMKKLNSEQQDRVDLKMGHSKHEAEEETTRKCVCQDWLLVGHCSLGQMSDKQLSSKELCLSSPSSHSSRTCHHRVVTMNACTVIQPTQSGKY